MEPIVHHTEAPISPILAGSTQPEAFVIGGDRIVRREFLPPYCNPPISNYRRYCPSLASAFWTAFGVRPSDGSVLNQLGTNPVTCQQTAFQDVGFGYTFKAALTTDYWFDVDIDAGPISTGHSTTTIQLELWGTNVAPVVVPLNCRFLKTTATIAACLTAGCQYTLIFTSKVAISVLPGQVKYGEVLTRFPRLVVNYIRPWGMESAAAESVQDETVDLEMALETLKAGGESGEVLLQPVSFKEIAQAGAAGFGGFNDGH
jgi:hypothetical protein